MMLQMPVRRALALVLAGSLAVLLLPGLALAHADLISSDPTDGSTRPGPFRGPVVLNFSETLALGSKAELYGTASVNHGNEPIAASKPNQMTISFDEALDFGSYRVEWVSIASDGDLVRGTVFFTVGPALAASTAPEPTPTATAAPSTTPAATSVAVTPVPSTGPSAAPAGGTGTSGSGSDVVLPIVAAMIVLGASAAYLLSRRNRPTDGT